MRRQALGSSCFERGGFGYSGVMNDHPTFGVEEELLLVDPATGLPVAKNEEVARSARREGVDLQLELTSCQVETTSPVSTTAVELGKHLRELRETAAKAATDAGVSLLAVAVPPAVSEKFPITDTPRYKRIADRFGMVAHEQGICGAHVHVSVPDREIAVGVSNRLRPWLPLLLALTANSAVYRGAETGYASWRSVLWQRWPCAGPPPYLRSASHFDQLVDMMVDSGAILDPGMVYWDIRPSANFPTVEIRVSDVPATVAESTLLATLVRALVMTATEDIARGAEEPQFEEQALRAAYWKGAHDGIGGEAIDVVDGRVLPAADLLNTLLTRVRPALDELGEFDSAARGVAEVLAHGNGAIRQLSALRRRGELSDVITECARRTLS